MGSWEVGGWRLEVVGCQLLLSVIGANLNGAEKKKAEGLKF